MVYLENFFTTTINLNIYLICIIAIIYIMIHQNRHRQFNQYLDVYLNYIPVLTHEFGHVLFNKISGGRAKDLVIVTRPSERLQTMQQGYAITQSKGAHWTIHYNSRWLYYASINAFNWSKCCVLWSP